METDKRQLTSSATMIYALTIPTQTTRLEVKSHSPPVRENSSLLDKEKEYDLQLANVSHYTFELDKGRRNSLT